MAANITERRQHLRITLSGDDGTDDPHAGRTGDVRDDMMQLQVHLHQGLVHVLNMGGRIFDQTFLLAQIGAQGGDLGLRPETAPQKAIGMQLAQPTGVADIGLAARHILGVARIHEDHIEPMPLENFEGRDPIDPSGVHGDVCHATGFEPIGQIMQILGECAKRKHRRVTGIGINRRHVHCRSDVDGGRRRVDHLQVRMAAGHYLCHAKAANGKPLLSGRTVTWFTNTEEAAAGLTDVVPFLVEDMLVANGGIYSKAADWASHVVVDGKLISGQNPASSKQAALALATLLG